MQIKIKDITLCALFTALIIAGTLLKIPMYPVAITLQTMIIMIAAVVLGYKSLISIGLYVTLGLLGLPIFSTGGGLGSVYTASFGFIIAFFPAAFLISALTKRYSVGMMVASFLLASLLIYIIGVAYMYLILKIDKPFWDVLQGAVCVFIPGDLLKCAVATLICTRLKKLRY